MTANTSGGANLMLAAPSFSGNLVALGSTAAQIDLQKIVFASLQTHFDEVSGVLSPSDGTSSSSLQFVGPLSQDNFQFAGDGLGGSLNSGAAAQAAGVMSEPVSLQGHDTFVFAAHFGQVRIDDFALGADKVVFTQSLFADQSALQAAIHDDTAGNAVITDAATGRDHRQACVDRRAAVASIELPHRLTVKLVQKFVSVDQTLSSVTAASKKSANTRIMRRMATGSRCSRLNARIARPLVPPLSIVMLILDNGCVP
ncbi:MULTISPECIES: hypothetical protein [unclassified Bradyrhizobium]|uniref:hypothetical protein n=1 Tax=unclassified Bradyrhizobium TaxID=2631580 RepID=UPI0028E41138|nr:MULTISPECIES: hypothetical protein [unclassified Bradyrhizobium]